MLNCNVICRPCTIGGYKSNRFTAFSLPGQFASWSESANRTLANSLPGPFAPWPFRSLVFSLPGTFVPRSELARELSLPGTFALESILSHFALWNFRSLLVL